MGNEHIQMIINLLAAFAFIFVLVYLLKKLKSAKSINQKQIKLINELSIGSKEKIILVEVNNTTLLIGATSNHIETLFVFHEKEDKIFVENEPNLNGLFSKQMPMKNENA